MTKKIIAPGDTLFSLLRQNGFSQKNISSSTDKKIFPKSFKLNAKDFYFHLKSAAFDAIKFIDPYREISYFFWKIGDHAGANVSNENFRRVVKTAEGKVVGSLIKSITDLTGHEAVAYRFLDAYHLDGRVARRLQKGARFSLTYELLYLDDTFVRAGEVLNTSLEIGDTIKEKIFLRLPEGGVFLNPSEGELKRPLFSPVSYISISSQFNPRRFHPIKKRRQPHWGTDFVMPPNSPVFSSQRGTIKNIGRTRAGGHFIRIQHPIGFETTYNHLSEVTKTLKKGQRIPAGQRIGSIGCTGYCTKPHLHFQVKKKGRIVDPTKYIKGYPHPYQPQVQAFLTKLNKN